MTVSTGSTVVNCVDEMVYSGTLMIVLVYDTTGIVVTMSQVSDNLPPLPVSDNTMVGVRKGEGAGLRVGVELGSPLHEPFIQPLSLTLMPPIYPHTTPYYYFYMPPHASISPWLPL